MFTFTLLEFLLIINTMYNLNYNLTKAPKNKQYHRLVDKINVEQNQEIIELLKKINIK